MTVVPFGGGGASGAMQIPLLTSAGYTSSAITVEAILDAHGLWGMVAPAAGAAVDAGSCKTVRGMLLPALGEDLLMEVAPKLTPGEVWDSLKVRFVGADRVKAARLATLCHEFDSQRMDDNDDLYAYAGKVYGMAARYAGLGAMLDDAAMAKNW